MKPLDPRLIRHAQAARRYIVVTAALGVALSVLVVAQALLVARAVGRLAAGDPFDGTALGHTVLALAGIVAARVAASWAQERYAHRAAIHTIAELRGAVLEHTVKLGPRGAGAGQLAKTTQLVTRGLDALDAYFARYLPQLLMVVTVTPILLLVAGFTDWQSALLLLLTIPLIPLFMILIGRLTQAASARRLRSMTTLGSQVLDLISGLPTLKALGRERGPAARVRALSQAHSKATFGTVRIAFLSGAALELIATLSVALVAVWVGLRLQAGHLDLVRGLAIIMIAPEVLAPLRHVGTHFHASANGVAASERAFDLLALPLPQAGTVPAPDLAQATITVSDLGVLAKGRGRLAPAGLSFTLEPGSLTALTGPNGAGKSTTVLALLGLIRPDAGRVTVQAPGGAPIDLADVAPDSWWNQIAWAPQRPMLLPGTALQNLLQDWDQPGAVSPAVEAAAAASGFAEVVASLPDGWHSAIGQGGVGLSVGQRQRLALARAFLSPSPLVILDEPTAHLDAATEAHVIASIEALHRAGRTVLVVAHRASLLAMAHQTVTVAWAPAQDAAEASEAAQAEPVQAREAWFL
ncbi:MAG: thiol reductant ABC exporter subunit CydD [Bifidobacteriaceae bacterium]|jgi:ATP-binding cassette subfamily C protein CydD|nr:thiol reductant ABC exporter subunit CydD [Bifidobacteriaceae bacterium]